MSSTLSLRSRVALGSLLLVRRRRVVRSPRRRRGRWLGGLLSTLRLWRLGVVLGRSLGWCVNARALT